MAVGAPKGTDKTSKPSVEDVNSQAATKPDPPTFRSIAKKVARMSLEGRLRIFVLAGLMTEDEAQAVAQRASKADRSKRKNSATKKGGRKSSS
jgi:hypothetical protein